MYHRLGKKRGRERMIGLGLGWLKKDVEDIKKEVKKTEYEKIREPLEQEISELRHNNYVIEKNVDNLVRSVKELIKDIENNNMQIPIFIDKPIVARYTNEDLSTFETKIVNIPVNQVAVEQIKLALQQAINSKE
jgi:replicative superfamily II helicase